MPTAAKLAAAVAFAMVAFFAAEAFKPAMPEGTQFGYFSPLTAVIGALVGWRVMGGLVGRGMVKAAGSGVRCSVTVVFWALLLFSIYEMVLRSTKLRYEGPMDAVLGIFDLILEYGQLLGKPDLLMILFIGGILGGMFAEWANRRWL